jgi:hypothetical protein
MTHLLLDEWGDCTSNVNHTATVKRPLHVRFLPVCPKRCKGLAFLRAIDPAEADAFSVAVVQDFEGVAVEDGDDRAGEVSG